MSYKCTCIKWDFLIAVSVCGTSPPPVSFAPTPPTSLLAWSLAAPFLGRPVFGTGKKVCRHRFILIQLSLVLIILILIYVVIPFGKWSYPWGICNITSTKRFFTRYPISNTFRILDYFFQCARCVSVFETGPCSRLESSCVDSTRLNSRFCLGSGPGSHALMLRHIVRSRS